MGGVAGAAYSSFKPLEVCLMSQVFAAWAGLLSAAGGGINALGVGCVNGVVHWFFSGVAYSLRALLRTVLLKVAKALAFPAGLWAMGASAGRWCCMV
jgi:hypothetical protein